MNDVVNNPSHYKANGIEVIDVIEAFGLDRDAYLFNVVTYILRADKKGAEDADLRKALNYLFRRVHGRWPHETGYPTLNYLATPYSKYVHGIGIAFEDAALLTARLLKAGIECYSPIVHCHPLTQHSNLDPLDHGLWLPYQEAMMRRCDALLVANMHGWKESKGIAHEIHFFAQAGKPIFALDVGSLQMAQLQALPLVTDDAGRNRSASLDSEKASP